MSAPYFPYYVGDYEADTAHLTVAEDGAYVRLLRLQWRTPGCKLPDDEAWLRRKVRATEREWEDVYLPVIEEFFKRSRGRLWSARLLAEFEKLTATSLKRSSAGKKGGRPRKQLEHKQFGESPAKANQKHPEPEPEPYPDPEDNNNKQGKDGLSVVVSRAGFGPEEMRGLCAPVADSPAWSERLLGEFIDDAIGKGWTVADLRRAAVDARQTLGPEVMQSPGYVSGVLVNWTNAEEWKRAPPDKPGPQEGFAAQVIARMRLKDG